MVSVWHMESRRRVAVPGRRRVCLVVGGVLQPVVGAHVEHPDDGVGRGVEGRVAQEAGRVFPVLPGGHRLNMDVTDRLRLVQNGSDRFRLVQIGSDRFRLVQNTSDRFSQHKQRG